MGQLQQYVNYIFPAIAVIVVIGIIYFSAKNKGGKFKGNPRPVEHTSKPMPASLPININSRMRTLGQAPAPDEVEPAKPEPLIENNVVANAEAILESTPAFEVVSKEGVINAIVLDDGTRSFGERHVDLLKNKDYGKPVGYFNRSLFYLHRFASGLIEPVPASPYDNLEHSPGETYEAVQNKEDIVMVFGKHVKGIQPKVWLFILGALAAIFILWMAYSSGGGE